MSAASPGFARGSEFAIRLPLAEGCSLPAAAAAPPTPNAQHPTPTRRVLVIEDNLDAAETLGDLLEMAGHQVRLAHSGQDGVSEAAARPHHGELVSRQSHGGHRRGCDFPSASRHLRAPGLLVVVHSGRHSTRLRDARLSRIAIVRQTRKRGARLPLPDGLSASTRVP